MVALHDKGTNAVVDLTGDPLSVTHNSSLKVNVSQLSKHCPIHEISRQISSDIVNFVGKNFKMR